jgi:hypothetical protein
VTEETREPDRPDRLNRPKRAGTEPVTWFERRRAKISAEIERNRRGEYKVPTWVLVVALVAIIGAWVAVIMFA